MKKSGLIILAILLLVSAGTIASTYANTFTVTKATNSNDGVCNADCSLREAVAAANDGDTIVFSIALSGQTFMLGGTEITVTKHITIDGALDDPNVVFLSGNMTSRHFYVKPTGELTLKNMILVQGNGGTVNLAGSGGSITTENGGRLILDRVSIRGNSATSGGALYLVGAASHVITNSSFTGNEAGFAAAILVGGNSTLYISNSTISHNQLKGLQNQVWGALTTFGNLYVRNCTIVYNEGVKGGGIFSGGSPTETTEIGNSIIAQNTATDSAPDLFFGGSNVLTSLGGNLIGNTESVPAGIFNKSHDETGSNPLLAPTNSNVGGFPIDTHPLQAGSHARNNGLNAIAVEPFSGTPLTHDARGVAFPRTSGGTVDKGAFEDQTNGSSLIVTKKTNSNDNVCDVDCSLREAIATAAADPGTDTITFHPSVFGTLTLGGTELTIQNQNVNIVGYPNLGADTLTISGSNTSRIFNVSNGLLSLTGLTLENGSGQGNSEPFGGGAILGSNCNINLDQVIMRNNHAAEFGGAMAIYDGITVRVMNSTINNNSANVGTALGIDAIQLFMFNTTVSTNARTNGANLGIGALNITNCSAKIRNSTIAFNRTPGGSAGGIRVFNSTVDLGNTIVSNNLADTGADISFASGTLTSAGGNLVQDINGFPAGTFNQTNDHTGIDPQLDVLTNNGGNVPTHALQAFSAAVGHGLNANAVDPFNDSGLSSDARGSGFPRIQNIVDKGAFESSSPTAANAIVTGRVVDEHGLSAAGVVISLSGTQSRKTITDANGSYRFDEVETNGFYTVAPARANYSFTPASRSFSQLGNKTESTFTGISWGDEINPLDTPEYFVRQQYLDLLGREPDEPGFNYWSDQILACGSDPQCVNTRRREVAAAFFIEQEFQLTGSFIYDTYAGTLGRKPALAEYSSDRQLVSGANLDTTKTAFAQGFVQRAEFTAKFQANTTASSFVDALLQSVQTTGVNLSSERTNLISAYNNAGNTVGSRAAVVRAIADNASFKQAQYNQAFVLTEYFGYLRRGPENDGYIFWVGVLNNGGNYRGLVCSFVTSAEYQHRFSIVVSRSNSECGQ